MATVGFLHTAGVHEAAFEELVATIAPDLAVVTVVDPVLLDAARQLGPEATSVRTGVTERLGELDRAGADVIVCTCSTIGEVAERLGAFAGAPVLRVDRPMLETAVGYGHRVGVIVAIESTVGPTLQLLREIAAPRSALPDITVHVCDGAWERFEAGDLEGYLDAVAHRCDEVAAGCDVLVLAQASKAAAAHRCRTAVPILSSPLSAVQVAVQRARAAG